jgi:lipopolysaccharide heptosyltransferase I
MPHQSRQSRIEIGPAPRILIVRLSALGDVVHGLPVLCALRQVFPDAHIGWVVEERAAAVLEGHAALNSLIRVPRGWLKSPRAVLRLRRRLTSERFDVSIDLQSLTKSALAARLCGARWRIGAGGRDGRELSKWFNNELVSIRASHVIEHYLALLRPLGIVDPQVHFRLPQWPQAVRTMNRFLSERGLLPGGFAIVNPGAGWASKQWPAERYAAVARFLGDRFGLPSVAMWAGTAERDLSQSIVTDGGGWVRLAPPTSIHELAELSRRAALFVGSDTGPLHLAVAAGTRAVSLHGTTKASWSGAYGAANLRLQAYFEDGTSRQRREADNRAMRAISVETVCHACTKLLAASHAPGRPALVAA